MEKRCFEKSFRQCSITGREYEKGSRFEFDIHIARKPLWGQELALYLLLEHNFDVMVPMLTGFMEEGLIPWGMMIFVRPGRLYPTLPGGSERYMRPEEFDQYGREFADFLVEELVPEACRISGETLMASPDMHFICGSSSGGLTAWNAVWFRNDFFRRTFLSSPTFSAIRGGEDAMVIVRKCEAKPVKLYITCGTEEPDYYFGSSLMAAQNAVAALEFAGYDFRYEQFNGEEHGARREDAALWRRMMSFLWANWQTVPVLPLNNNIRIRKLVADGSKWQKIDGAFPEKSPVTAQGGTYLFEAGTLLFEKDGVRKTVAGGFGKITALGLSSDKWRLYIADETRRFIFAMNIKEDGTLENLSKLAPLHLKYDFLKPGAADIAVLSNDRVLAATELGVQGVISFGLTDLILPLPGDLAVDKIAVHGTTLYALAGDELFCRELKIPGIEADSDPSTPDTGYGDGFPYMRSHLYFF
ncbi:MAG: hypothetical protein E7051_01245 [Lentisphaerae bacterium]|nr:hypothetical protein [Lentisphaerota bacterium]